MRIFYLKIDSNNATYQSGVWTSSLFDLYLNDSYRNYSTVKSGYGVDALHKGVWVGQTPDKLPTWRDLQGLTWRDVANRTWRFAGGTTSSGEITSDQRFVDTTGRIDLISYTVNAPNASTFTEPTPLLSVFNTPNLDSAFPSEYAQYIDITMSDGINIFNADRFAKFQFQFVNDPGDNWALYIRVEIDIPVMMPLYQETRNLLDKFPRWMAIREVDNVSATPTLSTPSSLGGKVINAIAGEWLEDINVHLTYLNLQRYISTVDLNQLAWVWKSGGVPQFVYSITGDGVQVGRAADQQELYEALPDEHVAFWDEENQTIYFNQLYDTLLINDVQYPQTYHHVWNYVDELGLLVDLNRLVLEDNSSFKNRILDVYINRGGVGSDSFKLALRRELNLWKYMPATPATPDSNYLGATPEIQELSDLEVDLNYIGPDGLPTDRFISLVNKLADQYPTTWGKFLWDKTFWDPGGIEGLGYGFLARQFDATPPALDHYQSGVGDGDDLYIYAPDVITGPHQVNVQLKIKGKQRSNITTYPPVKFDTYIYGTALKRVYNNPLTQVWYTIEVTTFDMGNPVYVASFEVGATSDADASKPSGSVSGYTLVDIFDNDDSTANWLTFYKKADGTLRLNRIAAGNIQRVILHTGYWDPTIRNYLAVTKPITDIFATWFSNDTTAQLIYTEGTIPTLTGTNGDPTVMPRAKLVMMSKQISYTVQSWYSEKALTHISVNDTPLSTTTSPVVLSMPNIVWDSYLDTTPNKQIVVELVTGDAITTDVNGSSQSLASSYLYLNGSNSWASNKILISPSASSLTFTVGSGGSYPVVTSNWSYFEASQINPYTGIVDQNGPWHNGIAPIASDGDFSFANASVKRSDFGIPDNDSYLITWIGAESTNDPQLMAWIDSNVVQPAITVPFYLGTYPSDAVVESLDIHGKYVFSPFVIRAKLQTNANSPWNPQINSGWFYEDQKEYYLFASPNIEYVTEMSSVLSDLPRQGAPIIVTTDEATPVSFREVSFFRPDASPTALSLVNTETIWGSDTNILYASYPNIYAINVFDQIANAPVPLVSSSTNSNQITTSIVTDKTHSYQITYQVNNSFYTDVDYEDTTGQQKALLVFDKSPANLGVSRYKATYESSLLNPATPVPISLNPLYTSFNEGFLFISHNEYTLDSIQVSLSPQVIVADGQDYIMVSLKSLDQFGNPKPNQDFDLVTTFGTFDHPHVTTDRDGFALTKLTSASNTNSDTGTITITGGVSATLSFSIDPVVLRGYRLLAACSTDEIPADGVSQNIVFGRVQDPSFNYIQHATVNWSMGRSLFDAFNASTNPVVTDVNGSFVIGPFTAALPTSPGYWFVVMETHNAASPNINYTSVGDVVCWYEYPNSAYGVEATSGLPIQIVQMATPPINTMYNSAVADPVSQWELATPMPATPIFAATPAVPKAWFPPSWYAIDKTRQIHLGLWNPATRVRTVIPYSRDI